MDFHIWIKRIRQVRKTFRFLKKCMSVHKKCRKQQMRKEKKQKGKLFQPFSHLCFSVPVGFGNVRKKVVGASRILWLVRNKYF